MKYSINIYRDKALHSVSFIGLFSLMMLTACSPETTEETVPDPVEELTPIAFRSGLANDEEVTRSEGLETKATSFRVWAYKNMSVDDNNTPNDPSDDDYGVDGVQTVMPGYTVNYGANTANTTTSNTNNWEYVNQQSSGQEEQQSLGQEEQTIKYWDWSAKAYRFFGVTDLTTVPSEASATQSFTIAVNTSSPENIAATPYFSHLWFSTGNRIDYPTRQFGQPVELEFLKPIAQVRIKFIFVEGLGIDRTQLDAISFRPTDANKDIAIAGNITITYPLSGKDTKESFTSSPTGFLTDNNHRGIILDSYEGNDNWYNVLPRDAQDSYTLSVVVVGGEPQTCVVPAEYMTWAPGYQYTYIFKIMETGGVTLEGIQVAINDWTIKEKIEHPVYNW